MYMIKINKPQLPWLQTAISHRPRCKNGSHPMYSYYPPTLSTPCSPRQGEVSGSRATVHLFLERRDSPSVYPSLSPPVQLLSSSLAGSLTPVHPLHTRHRSGWPRHAQAYTHTHTLATGNECFVRVESFTHDYMYAVEGSFVLLLLLS